MTTLENRPNTALIVIDVQNGVVAGNHERDAVVANIGSVVESIPAGSVSHEKKPPLGCVQRASAGMWRSSAPSISVHLRS